MSNWNSLTALVAGGLQGYAINKASEPARDRARQENEARQRQLDQQQESLDESGRLQAEATQRYAPPNSGMQGQQQTYTEAGADGQAPTSVQPYQPDNLTRQKHALHIADGMANFWMGKGDPQKFSEFSGRAALLRNELRKEASNRYFTAAKTGDEEGAMKSMRDFYGNWNDGNTLQAIKPDGQGGYSMSTRDDRTGNLIPHSMTKEQIGNAMMEASNPGIWGKVEYEQMAQKLQEMSPAGQRAAQKFSADMEHTQAQTEQSRASVGASQSQADLNKAYADNIRQGLPKEGAGKATAFRPYASGARSSSGARAGVAGEDGQIDYGKAEKDITAADTKGELTDDQRSIATKLYVQTPSMSPTDAKMIAQRGKDVYGFGDMTTQNGKLMGIPKREYQGAQYAYNGVAPKEVSYDDAIAAARAEPRIQKVSDEDLQKSGAVQALATQSKKSVDEVIADMRGKQKKGLMATLASDVSNKLNTLSGKGAAQPAVATEVDSLPETQALDAAVAGRNKADADYKAAYAAAQRYGLKQRRDDPSGYAKAMEALSTAEQNRNVAAAQKDKLQAAYENAVGGRTAFARPTAARMASQGIAGGQ
jgi:hypothetical protein